MPNMRMMSTALAIVVAAIFGIATSSIATECYNSDKKGTDLKGEKKDNFNFIIINLVCNIVMLLLGFGCIYLSVTSPA
jgi:uncharacterized protein YqhQ